MRLVIVLVASFISIYPVLYIFNVSLKKENAFSSRSLSLIPEGASFENYRVLIMETDFLLWMKNSLIVSITVVITGVTLAALSGYALSRFDFRGKKAALLTLLITQSFPATMLLLPFFILLAKLNLIDSYLGLFLIYSSTALPFCIWQMKSFYDTVPKELEEAALIDGCAPFTAYRKVIVPLSLPALAVTALFSFLTAWSEYAVAAVVIQDPALYTLPLGLKSFQASLATQWGLYAAGALIVSVPVVTVFLFLTRFLVGGLTAGGVKG
ncbi:MAG: ABC transporter permease subunit [Proteobacteria bacterium]|nr:MAG: ABC transporter permease subunit [Pseudomonadota bacterium]